jgi:hypothetical protein
VLKKTTGVDRRFVKSYDIAGPRYCDCLTGLALADATAFVPVVAWFAG